MLWILIFASFCCAETKHHIVKRFKANIKSNFDFTIKIPPKEPECGESFRNSHSRIVGGAPSVLGAWPWIALLIYTITEDPNDRYFGGGGALISLKHVLTAAHCVEHISPRKLSAVRLGELDVNPTVDDGAAPVEIPILNFITHPGYNHETSQVYPHHDISIINLKHPVIVTKYITPICLPTKPYLRTATFEKNTPFVVGWGYTSSKGPKSSALLEAQLPVVEHKRCKISYQKMNVNVSRGLLCAGGLGKDSCTGDSGGPLMLPHAGKYYLIGIVSLGLGCADEEYPGLYTKVNDYVDWILNNIR